MLFLLSFLLIRNQWLITYLLQRLRLAYNLNVSHCGFTYDIRRATDYYPYGRVLRRYVGGNTDVEHGYQGSENNTEIGPNDYYTHYRTLNTNVARWEQVDPVSHDNESPYVSMNGNPVLYNDVNGDCPTCPNQTPIYPGMVKYAYNSVNWVGKNILIPSLKVLPGVDNFMKTNKFLNALEKGSYGSAEDKPPVDGNVFGRTIHGEMPMTDGDTKGNSIKGHVDNMTDDKLPGSVLGGAGAKAQIFRYQQTALKKTINSVSGASDIIGTGDATATGLENPAQKILQNAKGLNRPTFDHDSTTITEIDENGNEVQTRNVNKKDVDLYFKTNNQKILGSHVPN